jgi:hypothetical protein
VNECHADVKTTNKDDITPILILPIMATRRRCGCW